MSYKAKKIIKWSLVSVLILAFFASVTVFFYQNSYAGKIYKNVSVAGIDLSGKTKKQAELLLDKKFSLISSKTVQFKAGQKTTTAALSETGLSFNISNSINEAFAIGRSQKFLPQLYASAQTSFVTNKISVPINIDNTKLNLFIAQKIPELNIPSTDASINITDGKVAISPDSNGQSVNASNLAADITKLISGSAKVYEIQLQATPLPANITTKDLTNLKSQAEDIIDAKINLTYLDKTYTPQLQDISKWISFTQDASTKKTKLSIDDAAIKSYLGSVSKDFEIVKKDKKINATDSSVIEEGVQGLYLDKDRALNEIKKAVYLETATTIALTTYTQDPAEVRVYPAEGFVPGKFPGKYLDADLTQQKMCRIEGNTIIDCFTISSGKPSTPTPVGIRYVESKNDRAWSAPYGLYMPWWQSLGGGYGVHELPEWPGGMKEGENHLGIPVSHGCIRLGVGPAKIVYDWTEIGTPVYIHK